MLFGWGVVVGVGCVRTVVGVVVVWGIAGVKGWYWGGCWARIGDVRRVVVRRSRFDVNGFMVDLCAGG